MVGEQMDFWAADVDVVVLVIYIYVVYCNSVGQNEFGLFLLLSLLFVCLVGWLVS